MNDDIHKAIYDAIMTGTGPYSSPTKQSISSKIRYKQAVSQDNPCYVFRKNKPVDIFTTIYPPADAYPYGTFAYIEKQWHRCSPDHPAPKRPKWLSVEEGDVPAKFRAELLLIS